MFRKMLVCTDLTPASEALVDCVAVLKSVGTEEVILTHVIHVANTPGLEDILIRDARPVLERQKNRLEERGIRVVLEMPFGLPAQTLDETAEQHDVCAVLIGSHGKGIIQAATLGSVSAQLLQQTRRPLLLARMELLTEGKSEAVCRNMFDRVLFPTDFSETAERALDYLGKIALETGCPVTLMHVIPAKDADADAARRREEDAGYLLEAKKRRLETLGAAEVAIDLVHGEAAEEIIGRTKAENFSLVIMGSQGKGFLKEILLGSTANEVARNSGAPLLFIPALC
ncbi:MAG: universal stress protein [Geobacteraceae bacterium GWC2_58_44]|nr:MAG: universal stress protein [Geobacteraceae bacterium GWC2_58_44]HBG07105.1 universal stress protein [Geobacter sp.]